MNSIPQKFRILSPAVIAITALAVSLTVSAGPGQAQTYPVSFPHPTTFLLNSDVGGSISPIQAAVVGDFNNDGKLDVVSMENPGGYFEIDVALGNGDGTFQTQLVQNLFPGNQHTHYAMAVGDFNGDGYLDLAVWGIYAPGTTSEVMIFLGNGNGTFTYGNTYTAPNSSNFAESTNSLCVADFNGDGHLDLAALTQYNGVYIYLGNGDGTFQTAVAYSTVDPNHPNNYIASGIAVGDLNGDSKPDIAVTESTGMAVLINNGNGAFGTATYYDSGTNASSEPGIAIGDVNGDKKNDVVITSWPNGQVLLYLNQGTGTFAVPTVVATLGISSWLVTIADINADKKMDLVVTDWAGEVWTFYGKGNGAFTAGPCYPVQWWEQPPSNVILADFNKDGALDIFKAGDHYWEGQVTLGRGDGTFQTNAAYGWSRTGFGQNLVTADFNGDGFPDVAFSWANFNSMPAFGVMLGSSHGALAAPTYVTYLSNACESNMPEWIATGDVNGDGKADIVATLRDYSGTGCMTEKIAVFTGLGTGKFSAPVFYSTGATAQSYDVFLADVNGDGKPDIIASNGDGTISVLLNNGKGAFGTASLISSVAALSPHQNALAIADFNGDGKLDIAVAPNYYAGSYSGNVYILLGNGDGTFQAPITVTAGPQGAYTSTLAAGDFNNDGKMDLLVTFEASSYGVCSSSYRGYAAYAVLKGSGSGSFTAGAPVCVGGDFPIYPVVGDFNGDGKLDAFLPMQEQYGTISGPVLLQGNGDGTFSRIGEFYTGSVSRGAVVADFNGNGMPDIAALNNDNAFNGDYVGFVTVMLNSSQPISISPLKLSLGNVAVGATKALTVLLTNNQKTSLTIGTMTMTGTNASEFTATSNCGTSRKPGWECTVTVKFTPTVTGVQTAALNITDGAGTQTVQLIGGVNPLPTITTLTPGSVLTGSPTFTLTVDGTGFITSSVVKWNGSPRTTTYVSPTEVTALINAVDIVKAATFKVTVTNPTPGGGTSVAVNFVVNNPAPTLISMLPTSAKHGGKAFTLTVTGTGYVSTSAVYWNTTKLATKYVSSTTLTATVPSTDIQTAGTAAVTVVTPAPGGGTSAPLTFTIN